MMYGFTTIAGSLVVYFIVDGTRPYDILFWASWRPCAGDRQELDNDYA